MNPLLLHATLMFGLVLACCPVAMSQSSVALAPESRIVYTASRPGETWSGSAAISQLEFDLNPADISGSSLTVRVKAADFNSGNIFRDTNARRTVLDAQTYPEIIFALDHATTEGNILENGRAQTVTLTGELTLHGVTNKIELPVTVILSDNSLSIQGSFSVLLSDFMMKRPSLFGTSVADEVRLELNLVGTLP